MNMEYSNKKKKFLSVLIALQLVTGYALPPAYAATTSEPAPETAPMGDASLLQAGDPRLLQATGLEDSLRNSQNADVANSKESALSKANTDREEEKSAEREKKQQINGTSDNSETSFWVMRSDGTYTRVTKNECYNSTDEEKCPSTRTRERVITNSNGTTQVISESYNSSEYIVDDGRDFDANVRQQIEIQKQQAKMLSSDSGSIVPEDYAASVVSATALSLQSKDMPKAQKFTLLAIAYQQAMNDAQQMQKEAKAKADKENAEKDKRLYERKTSQDRIQRAQKERDVLKTDDADGSSSFNDTSMFTVSITPDIPVNTDEKDVEITLTPKDKEAAKKGTMTALVTDPITGEQTTIDVTKQFQNADPIIVEFGKAARPEGTRTVTFTFIPNDGGRAKTFIVRYKVSAFLNAISSDTNQAVVSSVFSAYMNADLIIGTDNSIAVSGKISSASWDSEKNVCRITLSDTTGMRDGLAVSVITSNTTKDKCNAAAGKYAVFKNVRAMEQDDDSLLLRDFGSEGDDTNIELSLDGYTRTVEADALNLQNNTIGDKDTNGKSKNGSDAEKVVRMDPETGRYVYSLAGSLGYDYLLLPHGQMVSIYQDSAEKWHIAKVNGTEYSPQELAMISNRSAVNLDKATIEVDEDTQIPVIKDEDGRIVSSNSFDDGDHGIDDYSLENGIGTSWMDRFPSPVKTLVNIASNNLGGVTSNK